MIGFNHTMIGGGGSVNLADGLVAYYPFNGNANDESENANDGTNTNAVLTTDKDGTADSAYYFPNTDSKITVADNDKVDFANESFSVSIWDNTLSYSNPTSRVLLIKRDVAGYFSEIVNTTYFRFRISDEVNSAQIYISDQITTSTWTNRVVTVDRDTQLMTYYWNGVVQSQVDISTVGSLSNTADFAIGNAITIDRPFLGNIDNVRIYNKALTEKEITAINNRYV